MLAESSTSLALNVTLGVLIGLALLAGSLVAMVGSRERRAKRLTSEEGLVEADNVQRWG